ncbi:hypothetical protein C0W44_07970 [Photobacterium leiognathi subsp. mandapamensis]|nr:hypothetical protein C0W44_07970 [Photobacterium leiognathi subsp. mandapamensis]
MTRKTQFTYLLLGLFYTHFSFANGQHFMGNFYDAPDGVKVILGYNSHQYGLLYRVSKNLYVQTKNDAYLADIKLLIRKLQMSNSGREILRQIGTYTPINAPDDAVSPLIEYTVGVDSSKTTVATVIREPESQGRLFETKASEFSEPEQIAEALQRQSNGKGLSNTVFFSTTEVVNIPGVNSPFDQAVALGHELIHARDYSSGAMPQGNVHLIHRHPEHQAITEYSIANAEYQTTGIAHYNNAQNGRPADTNISEVRLRAINAREKIYYDWKKLGQEKPKTFLTNEQVVSEYHLADDLGAKKRNTYWPAEQYQYHPYPVDVRPASYRLSEPSWDTLEGKQAHIEVKRALKQSLSEGKQPAIVLIDPTEQRLSRSLSNSPTVTRRGLGNQSSVLKYAAQNDIKVINVYSAANETPVGSLKRRKSQKLYRALSGKKAQSPIEYQDVQYEAQTHNQLNQALEEHNDILVMAYSDGEVTTDVINNLSQDLDKQVMISRYSNLDYRPSDLTPKEQTAWRQVNEKENVTMLGAGSQRKLNICNIQ